MIAAHDPLPFLKIDIFLAWSLFFFLYAETHYRFRFAPSRFYRRRPEIIADAPHRLEPGQALPVLLLIKDAHRFPVALQQVRVEIAPAPAAEQRAAFAFFSQKSSALKFTLQDLREDISAPWWWRIYFVELPPEFAGLLAVNVNVSYRCGGKDFFCWNDNHAGTSHAPLQVLRSLWPLPSLPGYHYGDLHFHSDATCDQVEFGAPVAAAITMGRAQGLSFCGVTDHSYDLDDFPDDYLHNDPALRKWHALQERIRHANAQLHDFAVIPGEEVSCGNAAGGNVHFLIFNHPHFIPGSGDSGEKWLRTAPEFSVREILHQLDENALAFAAHPAAPVPFLQRKLLRRDCWQREDFSLPRLNGMQFWNGGAQGEEQGLRWWIGFLLEGKKLAAIAGNDAHGNFNRFRQIALPCLTMSEHPRHVFGRFRTAVKLKTRLTLESVLNALRHGCATLTNGLLVELELISQDDEIFWPGAQAAQAIARIRVRAISSPEFGRLQRVTIWRGNLKLKQEEVLYEYKNFTENYEFEAGLQWPALPENCYVRAEAVSSSASPSCSSRALTNPIWVGAQT